MSYIYREALQQALERKKAGPANRRFTEGYNDAIMRVKSMISKAPAAKVAPIVFCSECVNHCDTDGEHWCKFWHMCCPDDSEFYCKAGVRK